MSPQNANGFRLLWSTFVVMVVAYSLIVVAREYPKTSITVCLISVLIAAFFVGRAKTSESSIKETKR